MTFPLTQFLIDLMRGRLPSRDPRRLAQHYGISPDHASGYIADARRFQP